MEKGEIPEELMAQSRAELYRLYERRDTAGFPVTPEFTEQYEEEKEYDESYADWFRRAILVKQAEAQVGLPGPDWVGWHPAVDLDDIKLKVVENAGLDMHDFDLWESDARAAVHREYLEDAAKELVEVETPKDGRTEAETQQEIEKILADLGILGQVHVYALSSNEDENTYTIQLEISEDRRAEVKEVLREMAS